MKYRIELSRQAKKSLARMHPKDQKSARERLLELETEPRKKSTALSGQFAGLRKNRDGNVRIVFYLHDDELIVEVENNLYRGSSYKR